MADILIEPLAKHKRGAFRCGLDKIDNFFKNNASKWHAAYAQRVFVARAERDDTPLGFYALTTMTFKTGMDEAADAKFGRHDAIPTIYLTMIARHKEAEPGLGEVLMQDAIRRSLVVRDNIGVYALTLHAYNERVEEIYAKQGFELFSERKQDQDYGDGNVHRAMFLRLADAAAAFSAVEEPQA